MRIHSLVIVGSETKKKLHQIVFVNERKKTHFFNVNNSVNLAGEKINCSFYLIFFI